MLNFSGDPLFAGPVLRVPLDIVPATTSQFGTYYSRLTDQFKLQVSSPAIDTGTNVGLPFNGSAPDMGAFEY
jgi:hypothetical protein